MKLIYKNQKAELGTYTDGKYHVTFYRKGWLFWKQKYSKIIDNESILDKIMTKLVNTYGEERLEKMRMYDEILKALRKGDE